MDYGLVVLYFLGLLVVGVSAQSGNCTCEDLEGVKNASEKAISSMTEQFQAMTKRLVELEKTSEKQKNKIRLQKARIQSLKNCKKEMEKTEETTRVIPTWGEWTDWTPCSATCGIGKKRRARKCVGGCPTECQGMSEIQLPCKNDPCQTEVTVMAPRWGEWKKTECSVTCGLGNQRRVRECIGGRSVEDCDGASEIQLPCRKNPCKTEETAMTPTWGEWKKTECSVTCGVGNQRRVRECIGGLSVADCDGASEIQLPCRNNPCKTATTQPPITRAGSRSTWGDWGEWTKCSATCGAGMRHRRRPCIGGASVNDCEGVSRLESMCLQDPCHSGFSPSSKESSASWSEWTEWTECSAICGPGTTKRTRICTGQTDERDCRGRSTQEKQCLNWRCQVRKPVLAIWSKWSRWSDCLTFGRNAIGMQTRTRSCNTRGCSGKPYEKRRCTKSTSQIRPDTTTTRIPQTTMTREMSVWGNWSEWTECKGFRCVGAISLSDGSQKRTRQCSGRNCEGNRYQERTCSGNCEPVLDSRTITPWSAWSECSVTCGTGHTTRKRNCTFELCRLVDRERKKECFLGHCSPNATTTTGMPETTTTQEMSVWGSWSDWTECKGFRCVGAMSLSNGSQNRSRQCNGQNCEGNSSEERTCAGKCNFLSDIKTLLGIPSWSAWSECSVTCGFGHTARQRNCTDSFCRPDDREQQKECYRGPCSSGARDGPRLKCALFRSGYCFSFIDGKKNISKSEHEKFCEKYDGHLANVYDEKHQKALNKAFSQQKLEADYLWTGMVLSRELGFVAHDGSRASLDQWKLLNPPTNGTWKNIVLEGSAGHNISSTRGLMVVPSAAKYRYSICEYERKFEN